MMDTPQTREADACWDGAADGNAEDGGGGSDGGASECESSGDFIFARRSLLRMVTVIEKKWQLAKYESMTDSR